MKNHDILMRNAPLSTNYTLDAGRFLLFLLMVIITLNIYDVMKPANGITEFINRANTTLSEVDKNLTSSQVSLALAQINDSLISSDEDSKLDLEMAQGTIGNLIIGLSIKSDHWNLTTSDGVLCHKHPIDCIIGDLRFASKSITNNHPEIAQGLLNNLTK
jgi:hypothetical protein